MVVGSFRVRRPRLSLARSRLLVRGRGADERPGLTLWCRFKEDCLVEVSEVMTKEVVTVGPHYNVADVASLMDAKGIGSVIVLEEDRVLGILTERDILKVIGAGEDPKNVAAHEALIGDLYTIAPDASIEDAANQMTQARVRHLPVIADDQIVGIVSIRDVVRWSVREMAQAAELPHLDVSRQVLSIVHPADAATNPS
jgi:CBS domain-containing protein